jgi:hypothetical protein
MGISLTQLREMPVDERRDMFALMQEVSYGVLQTGKTEGVTI